MSTSTCASAVTAAVVRGAFRDRTVRRRAFANVSAHLNESSTDRFAGFAVGGEPICRGTKATAVRATRNDDDRFRGDTGNETYDRGAASPRAVRQNGGGKHEEAWLDDDERRWGNFASSSSNATDSPQKNGKKPGQPPPDVTLLTSRETQALLPIGATGEQYAYFWGGPETATQRLGASLLGLVATVNVATALAVPAVTFFLWAPVALAARRNAGARKGRNLGLWRARVISANAKESPPTPGFYDRDINAPESWMLELIIGDDSGAVVDVRVPLRRSHADVEAGDTCEMVVSSDDNYFRRFDAVNEVYFPQNNTWIGEYPFLDRRAMPKVSSRIARDVEARTQWEAKNRGEGFLDEEYL